MITGNEMNTIRQNVMKEIMRTVATASHDGGAVNQACKDAIVDDGVWRLVYNVYVPDAYNRRYRGGGLADENNLLTTTTASNTRVTIDIEDRTPSNGDGVVESDPVFYLSDIIESGAHGRRWPDSDWPGARPYMEESV